MELCLQSKTMKTTRTNQQGFTLIELLVVIAIIAILAFRDDSARYLFISTTYRRIRKLR